jgi:hypothetical protein
MARKSPALPTALLAECPLSDCRKQPTPIDAKGIHLFPSVARFHRALARLNRESALGSQASCLTRQTGFQPVSAYLVNPDNPAPCHDSDRGELALLFPHFFHPSGEINKSSKSLKPSMTQGFDPFHAFINCGFEVASIKDQSSGSGTGSIIGSSSLGV